jgi:hypothetical protein
MEEYAPSLACSTVDMRKHFKIFRSSPPWPNSMAPKRPKESTTSHCIRRGIGLCRGIFLSVCTDYRGVIRRRFGLPHPERALVTVCAIGRRLPSRNIV